MTAAVPVNKLKAAMQSMAGTATPPDHVLPTVDTPIARAPASRPPSRNGKRNLSAYINEAAAKQLRLLAVERDATSQALVEEALNDLFRKHGKSAIA